MSSEFIIEDYIDIENLSSFAVINETIAIVSLLGKSQFQFLQLQSKLILLNLIKLEDWCFGMDAMNKTIYVACINNAEQSYIQVLDVEGNVKGKFDVGHKFQQPNFLKVSPTSGKIYVSDLNAATVTCLSPNGFVIFSYWSNSLATPDDILIDDQDNIAVCTLDDVQVIDQTGQKLTPTDGIYDPETMAYRRADGMLIVAGYVTNDMFEFELTH